MEKEKAKLLRQQIKAAQIMLEEIDKSLKDFLGEDGELPQEKQVEEKFLGDDGKLYEKSTPYMKAKTWHCCGRELERNGKVFHCSICGANYGA